MTSALTNHITDEVLTSYRRSKRTRNVAIWVVAACISAVIAIAAFSFASTLNAVRDDLNESRAETVAAKREANALRDKVDDLNFSTAQAISMATCRAKLVSLLEERQSTFLLAEGRALAALADDDDQAFKDAVASVRKADKPYDDAVARLGDWERRGGLPCPIGG